MIRLFCFRCKLAFGPDEIPIAEPFWYTINGKEYCEHRYYCDDCHDKEFGINEDKLYYRKFIKDKVQ